ncbi:MAG TPA: GDSL-type esterase/lipase family protein [Methylomirabilota bacterium]|nr:GDSL-type esterase/lipase family protein [Methylomirabilota bacterium]
MSRSFLHVSVLGLAMAAADGARAQPAPAPAGISGRADQPSPRQDQNSQIAHTELLAKARTGRIDLYFIGDSITRRWGTSDPQYKDFLAHWTTNFFGWNAGNFGWGGDTIQNILWRLHHGELDGVHPKVIVLMASANNVGATAPPPGTEDAKAEDIVRGLRATIDLMRQKAPGATILLMGITPRNDRGSMAVMPLINRINDRLAGLADGSTIRFLNLNDKLADKDGRLFEGMTVDGLHLSLRGYQVWADALRPVLLELLGPPAKRDHAPPPTGDPSLRKPAAPGQ